ncbi:glycosyltransferase [Patescibacteria group bacterium]|nr:glycosyltransferase [Patescibacteria group bacterium]
MKILILSWRDIKHPWRGGSEVYLHELAKKFVKSGHEVTYFCSAHQGGSLPSENIDGINIVRRGNRGTVYIWAFLYYLTKFRHKFDIVIDQHNGIPFFSPIYISSIPVVCLSHHIHLWQWFKEIYFPFNYIGYFLEKHLFAFCYKYNQFIAVSQSTKQDMIDLLGINTNQISIIHNAVAPYFQKTAPKTKHPSLIYVGRLKKYKRIDYLIRSLLRLIYKYPQLKLHIVGTGEEQKPLNDLVIRLGLVRHVEFHGYVSEELKVNLLSSSWLFVTPSSHEGWGLSVLEAAACGTTAVGSNIPGLRDCIQDQRTGLLFQPESIYDLSMCVDQILSNTGLRYKLEKEAVLHSINYKWSASARKFIRLLDKTVRETKNISNFKPLKSKIMTKLDQKPLVSIILPTKNVAEYFRTCLESIKHQSYPNIEIIVVDNYSTDGTYQMAKQYTNQVYSHGPERNQQRNYAVHKASGKYLMFIDSDMTLDRELVADCVYRLERFQKSVAVVLPELQIGRSIWSKARALEKEFYLGDRSIEAPRFFQKAAYQASGGYDENLLYAEDMELSSRIKKIGNITRSVYYIYHNEDRLGYFDILRKKYFYGQTAKYYFVKQSQTKTSLTSKQSFGQKISDFINNPVVSLTTAFLPSKQLSTKSHQTTKFIRPAFIEQWPKFLDNPLISLTFIFLRTTELTAMGFGYLHSLLKTEHKEIRVNKN